MPHITTGKVLCILQWESKKFPPPPAVFWHFFKNGWEFLINFLQTYYTFIPTLDCKSLFNYLHQFWRSYANLCHTKRDHPSNFWHLTRT